MSNGENEKPAPVLDPIERVSETIFGLLMALTFTGSLSVATAGREDIRTMMIAALGCNLAWGLADAVMYLVRTVTERTRRRTLLAQLRAADAATEWMTVAGASTLWTSDDDQIRRPEELRRLVYASANLIHRLTPTLIVGGEVLWGRATQVEGESATNVRVQLSLRYLIF